VRQKQGLQQEKTPPHPDRFLGWCSASPRVKPNDCVQTENSDALLSFVAGGSVFCCRSEKGQAGMEKEVSGKKPCCKTEKLKGYS